MFAFGSSKMNLSLIFRGKKMRSYLQPLIEKSTVEIMVIYMHMKNKLQSCLNLNHDFLINGHDPSLLPLKYVSLLRS